MPALSAFSGYDYFMILILLAEGVDSAVPASLDGVVSSALMALFPSSLASLGCFLAPVMTLNLFSAGLLELLLLLLYP